MSHPYLEVTFRHGRPLAAYLRLAPKGRAKAASTRPIAPGLVGDFAADGEPLGIEILAFDETTLARVNDVLAALGRPALDPKELGPLRAA